MQGKDGLNKDEIEEGASITRLDQCSTRLLRLKCYNLRGAKQATTWMLQQR